MLAENQPAPNFEGHISETETISLQQLHGYKVLLYFYPKDDTPGCTAQACNFRDSSKNLATLNVKVIGVSRDPVSSHKKFVEKYRLNFPLIADVKSEICQAYGVLVEKSRFGKKYKGIERSSFLIDEQGKIIKIWRHVKAQEHMEEVLAFLKSK